MKTCTRCCQTSTDGTVAVHSWVNHTFIFSAQFREAAKKVNFLVSRPLRPNPGGPSKYFWPSELKKK